MHESETINEVKDDLFRLGNRVVTQILPNYVKGYTEIIDEMIAEDLNLLH